MNSPERVLLSPREVAAKPASEAIPLIERQQDPAVLRVLLRIELERNGQKRTRVIRAIRTRIEVIEQWREVLLE